ncbi:MAG TPA: prepilin-type N-terminal cleavage/methylation domain-containing protein [Candidatus Paceibacterota bacterium]
MRLPKLSADKKGLTLIEVVITMAILAIIGGLGLFVSTDFYRGYILRTERDTLVSILQRQRSRALNNVSDSHHGVFLETDQYTVFQGNSYASRNPDYDEVINLPSSVVIGGINEVVFESLSGDSSASGDITISRDPQTFTISLNNEGRINY